MKGSPKARSTGCVPTSVPGGGGGQEALAGCGTGQGSLGWVAVLGSDVTGKQEA